MKGFTYILIFLFTIPLTSYRQSTDNDLENVKYLNFLAAIENRSTFSYFTVIKIKNLNNGEIKEICVRGNLVLGALHWELNMGYDTISQRKVLEFAKTKKDRYFEFKNKKALENISFFKYKTKLIDKIQTEYDIDKTIEMIKNTKEFSIRLPIDKMKAFAHVLFNKGFLSGESNCVGGALDYVDIR